MPVNTCPGCGLKTRMGTLLARFENNHLRLDWPAVPKPLPVILLLHRPQSEQPETLQWIFDWVKADPQPRVAQIQEILAQRGEREPDHHGWYDELSGDSQRLERALAFGCHARLKGADVGQGLLGPQLDRTVRETVISPSLDELKEQMLN